VGKCPGPKGKRGPFVVPRSPRFPLLVTNLMPEINLHLVGFLTKGKKKREKVTPGERGPKGRSRPQIIRGSNPNK